MSYFQAIFLGFIQGITEFLPISSSGHLYIFSLICGVDESSNLFLGIILHIGTLLSVLICLRKKIVKLFSTEKKYLFYLMLSSIPSALLGVFASSIIDCVFYNIQYVICAFMFTAILLFYENFLPKNTNNFFSKKQAICMGFSQCLALFPGVSRSGTTIVFGRISGGNKEDCVTFSFLMSIPIILGSLFFEIIKLSQGEIQAYFSLELLVGLFSSFIFGLLSIKFLLKVLNGKSFIGFSIYLILLSVFCFFYFYA